MIKQEIIKGIYTTLLLASLFIGCSNPVEINEEITETGNTSDTPPEDTTETASSDALNYAFFERVENTWDYPTENTILTEHGFVFKSLDTIELDQYIIIKAVFNKPDSDDRIEISDTEYKDGEVVFSIDYSTSSKLQYDSIQQTLSGAESLYIEKDEQFEKFGLGNYEDKVFKRSQTVKNGERKYNVKYNHRIGKELTVTSLIEEELNL